jgi:hypothetical protein
MSPAQDYEFLKPGVVEYSFLMTKASRAAVGQ